MILVVDNHDSFTWNLVHALALSGDDVRVVESDAVSVAEVIALSPRGVVLSPGPGRPEDAGVSLALVQQLLGALPILGVCLGHQTLCAALGARVTYAQRPMHGQCSLVRHDGRGVFTALPNPLRVARYHSLVVDAASLPSALLGTAFTDQGELMAVRHAHVDAEGVQFHPESFLTQGGAQLVRNWVARLPSRSPLGKAAVTFEPHV